MAFQFRIELEGSEDFEGHSAKLTSFAKLFQNKRRAWGGLLMEIGEYFLGQIAEEFATEGAKTGGWAPLSDDYAAWKSLEVGNQSMLVLYGDYSDMENAWHVEPISDDAVVIFSDFEETIHFWHTYGTDHMPARPVFVITPEDLANVDKMFIEHFDGVFFSRLMEAM